MESWQKVTKCVLVVFSLLAGFYAMNHFFVPREIFDLASAQTKSAIIGIQKNIAIQRAQDQLDALQRQENNLLQMKLMVRPDQKNDIEKMIETIRRQQAETRRRINRLQGQ